MPARRARASSAGSTPEPPRRTASAEATARLAAGSRRIRTSWVGTREVYRRAADGREARRPSASAVGLNPVLVSMTTGTVEAIRERMRICRPATWWAGRGRSQVPGPPRRSWVARAEATRAAALTAMSLPVPVVEPEVRRTRSLRGGTRVTRRLRSSWTRPGSSSGPTGTSRVRGVVVLRPSRAGSRPRRERRAARAERRAVTSSGAVPPVRRRRVGTVGTGRSCHGPSETNGSGEVGSSREGVGGAGRLG